MTTTTLDPTAEPLLDEPDNRTCELNDHPDDGGQPCGRPAAWVATGRCGTPGCTVERVLICQPCQTDLTNGVPIYCTDCDALVEVTWMEPIR